MAIVKTAEELDLMRQSGAILAECLAEVLSQVEPGISTNDLDRFFMKAINKIDGVEPLFLGYHNYPKAICTSVNDEVVHGIPTDRILQDGDIIGIDCGVKYQGYCADMARTVVVGEVLPETQKLLSITEEAKAIGIKQMQPGNTIGDVGSAIQEFVESKGYSVVRVLVGHGIGTEMHEDPALPNYGKAGTGVTLEPGMVLAIEPMVNIGGPEVEVLDDGWTVITTDGSLSAHFEDTVAITEQGPEVLTKKK